MTPLMQSEVFFFISSVGFVVLGILGIVLAVLCIRVVNSFMRILTKVENSMDTIGDATMDLIDDMRDNMFFRMIFNPKKSPRERSVQRAQRNVRPPKD